MTTRDWCVPAQKMRYPDEYAARVALVGCIVGRNRGQAQRRERRVYECNTCGGWHLTSMPAPLAAGKAREEA